MDKDQAPASGAKNSAGRSLRYSRPRVQPPETLLDFLSNKFKYLTKQQWCEHIAAGHLRINERLIESGEVILQQQDVINFIVPRELEPDIDDKVEFLLVDSDVVVMLKSGNIPVSEGGKYCSNTLRHVASRALAERAKPKSGQEQTFPHEEGEEAESKDRVEKDSPPALLFPVHRLDKETSGIVVMARHAAAAAALTAQFAQHAEKQEGKADDVAAAATLSAHKVYEAVLDGAMEVGTSVEISHSIGFEHEADPAGDSTVVASSSQREADAKEEAETKTMRRIRMRCFPASSGKGKTARTVVQPLVSCNKLTFARITIYTGRTHQIRCHCASVGHPIVGDKLYSRDDEPPVSNALYLARAKGTVDVVHALVGKVPRHLLHAASLSFMHPRHLLPSGVIEGDVSDVVEMRGKKHGRSLEGDVEDGGVNAARDTEKKIERQTPQPSMTSFTSSSVEWFLRDCPMLSTLLFGNPEVCAL